MRFVSINNYVSFETIYKRFCYNLEIYMLTIPIRLIMYRNQKCNYFVSETESNANGNSQHDRTGRDNTVPHIQNSRRSRSRINRFQESINEGLNGNNLYYLPFNPYISQQSNYINGFNPSISLNQNFSTCSNTSITYVQDCNYVSFRRGDTKSPGKSNNFNKEIRKWKNTKLGSIISPDGLNNKKAGTFFSIMNYNVLAQNLLQQHIGVYARNERNALKWEFRWNNLLNEIIEHDCDILCLQEVQQSHIVTHYNKLETLGYSGIYKQATGIKIDGCAIYYKRDKFKLIEHISVEYMQRNTNILNRDNIALIAKFSPLNNLSAEFIVSTTHLLYNPKREDVRLAQSQVLLTEVERMAFNPNKGDYVPIIITGDFNSMPNSTIYELITTGSTDYTKVLKPNHSNNWISPQLSITDNCEHATLLQYRRRNQILNRDEEFSVIKLQHSEKTIIAKNDHLKSDSNKNVAGKINHNFQFKSVYENCVDEGTTYQNKWVIVDYIFYSGKKLKNRRLDDSLILLSSYTLPKGKDLDSLVIPNQKLGSDHLALVAKFKLEY